MQAGGHRTHILLFWSSKKYYSGHFVKHIPAFIWEFNAKIVDIDPISTLNTASLTEMKSFNEVKSKNPALQVVQLD